jgi:hypothetical protein
LGLADAAASVVVHSLSALPVVHSLSALTRAGIVAVHAVLERVGEKAARPRDPRFGARVKEYSAAAVAAAA